MKDNFYFMDEYFMGIQFTYPSKQIGPPVLWFKPENFKKVIAICKEKGLGISVIEVYKDGYADTLLSDDFGGNPYDSNWYFTEYENLVKKYFKDSDDKTVLFSGWYIEPSNTNQTTANSSKPKSKLSWLQKIFGFK
jgi:hypothetical protein